MSPQLSSTFNFNTTSFTERLNSIRLALSEGGNDNAWAFDQLFPEPISVHQSTYALLESFCKLVARAGKAIVENYHHDEKIRKVLKLSSKSQEIIEALRDQPYRGVGTIRPDIIIDQDGFPRMCEINSRFPFNGFLLSALLHNAAVRCSDGDNSIFPLQKEMLHLLLPDGDIIVVKGRERGMDISIFADEMANKGNRVKYVPPLSEALARRTQSAEWKSEKVVFELHQSEIEAIPVNILAELNQKVFLNDLRTVLILHDKRLLAVLTDSEVMKQYVSRDDLSLLKSIIIPTFVSGLSPEVKQEAFENKDKWIFKPNLLGKSIGIIVGKKRTQNDWENCLNNPEFSDYVLQPLISGCETPIPYLDKDQKLRYCPTKIVGTLLQYNETFLGPGMFRAGMGEVLWDARHVIIPAINSGDFSSREFKWKL